QCIRYDLHSDRQAAFGEANGHGRRQQARERGHPCPHGLVSVADVRAVDYDPARRHVGRRWLVSRPRPSSMNTRCCQPRATCGARSIGWSRRIGNTGAKITRSSPLVPDLALQGRTYTRLLLSVFGTDLPENVYLRLQDVAKSIPSTDTSL